MGWKIQREVKNTGNGVDEGKHCLEGPCENPCGGTGAGGHHRASVGLWEDGSLVRPGASKDLFGGFVLEYTSVLATAGGLTVMSLMNVAQGIFQVEGEMWDFLFV